MWLMAIILNSTSTDQVNSSHFLISVYSLIGDIITQCNSQTRFYNIFKALITHKITFFPELQTQVFFFLKLE